MKHFLRASISTVLCAAFCAATPLRAQNAPPAPSPIDVETALERGRDLLESNDLRSVEALRNVAQSALDAVTRNSAEVSTNASPEAFARLNSAREMAAEAHLLWGQAADRFARRDEAVTALARAISLGSTPTVPDKGFTTPAVAPRVVRDARATIGSALRNGLPLYIPDDAIDSIARAVQGGLWTPRRISFPLPTTILPPNTSFGRSGSTVEFLVTSGKLFPPEDPSALEGESRLTRVPPLYRAFAPETLPSSLRMDRVLFGFARETNGPNRGLWRQVVRVFYTSNYGTQNNRDDRPRAEALAEMFLKTWATNRAALGVENPYAPGGVSTLWLLEVSSSWPQDDDDPVVKSQLPPRMPNPNTPLNTGEGTRREIAETPFSRPWRASAQLDSAPGEILFFKSGYARDEAEWLRETMHELGHVSLPPFDGFVPPLEPFGNGVMGEILGSLWAASAPENWAPSDAALALLKAASNKPSADEDIRVAPSTVEFDRTAFAAALNKHTTTNALAAFDSWKKDGPFSPLRRDGETAGLRYLAGSTLYIERVWGAPALGAALKNARAKSSKTLRADDLLNAFAETQAGQATNTIWLGGALEGKIDILSFRERREAELALGQKRAAWLWIPPNVKGLRVFYGAKPGTSKTLPGVKVVGFRAEPRAEKTGYSTLIPTGTTRGWTKLVFESYPAVTIGLAQWEK